MTWIFIDVKMLPDLNQRQLWIPTFSIYMYMSVDCYYMHIFFHFFITNWKNYL